VCDAVLPQEQSGETEKQEEPHAVGDERQDNAGALRRVSPGAVQEERHGR